MQLLLLYYFLQNIADTGVYTVTPQPSVTLTTTTEFEGLSLANLAYKSIVSAIIKILSL